MTTIEAAEPGRELPGATRLLVVRRARRRDELQMLGVLLGTLGVVLLLALTVGLPPPI